MMRFAFDRINKKCRYYIAKIKCKITHSHEPMADFYRRGGVTIGKGCLICSYLLTREPYLIEIGDNTTISTGVSFVTHDNCAKLLFPGKSDFFGKIVIGNNCFIGEKATLLYGVTLADNIIVGAGSVVTKSFSQERIIIGGNPARIIGTWDKLIEKSKDKAMRRQDMEARIKSDDSFLVKR